MPKVQLLCTPVPNGISETEFWVTQKRVALSLCQEKAGQSGLLPQKNYVSSLGEGMESFIVMVQRRHGQPVESLLIDWW